MNRGFHTRCLHLEEAEGKKENFGAISYPIYQTATYAHPGVGISTGYDYSRLQNPTREQLEKIVASLEDGIDAFALSSGMAAITLLMELFQPGDHFVVEADLYGGSIRLFEHVSKKNHYEFTYLDCAEDDIEGAIRENTKAIYLETPTNPMMNVSDISAIAEIAKKHQLLLIVDNTFLSPYFQNPLKLGADVVIHSGTKFLGGHNDTLAGFLVQILERVRMIKFAESLGGVETLITYPTTQTHADVPEEVRLKNGITPCTLRLSTGIEDAEDLLAELSDVFQSLE